MPLIEGGVKLNYGSYAEIVRRLQRRSRRTVSLGHVRMVARGEREGSAALVREIQETARRQQAERDAKAKRSAAA